MSGKQLAGKRPLLLRLGWFLAQNRDVAIVVPHNWAPFSVDYEPGSLERARGR